MVHVMSKIMKLSLYLLKLFFPHTVYYCTTDTANDDILITVVQLYACLLVFCSTWSSTSIYRSRTAKLITEGKQTPGK